MKIIEKVKYETKSFQTKLFSHVEANCSTVWKIDDLHIWIYKKVDEKLVLKLKYTGWFFRKLSGILNTGHNLKGTGTFFRPDGDLPPNFY